MTLQNDILQQFDDNVLAYEELWERLLLNYTEDEIFRALESMIDEGHIAIPQYGYYEKK